MQQNTRAVAVVVLLVTVYSAFVPLTTANDSCAFHDFDLDTVFHGFSAFF